MKIHSIIKCVHSHGREKPYYFLSKCRGLISRRELSFIWEPTLIEIFDYQDEAFWGAVKHRSLNISG